MGALLSVQPCDCPLHACRAGFIVVDLVLLFLVAAFVTSTLINFFCALFDRHHGGKEPSIWARRTFLLLDCITCAVMIISKHSQAFCLSLTQVMLLVVLASGLQCSRVLRLHRVTCLLLHARRMGMYIHSYRKDAAATEGVYVTQVPHPCS